MARPLMQFLILLLTLLASDVPDAYVDRIERYITFAVECEDMIKSYRLASEWVYPRSPHIGSLLELRHHHCRGGAYAHDWPMKVALKPLYDASEQLNGFEFRTLHIIVRTCKLISRTTWCCWDDPKEIWYNYSTALTEEEQLLYTIMD